ncbi:ectoine hydroxylase-related dioxygenase (phytanoyl-CoA dioxygenase family) [Cupriavidus metallidurans]|uniref:phytanoyl-CoA dioxygenase family protein n=1 Tax=Cupriavidus metallidurans TaxID=119219 RepID=UPI000564DD0B|nr:phytanoyl-CoA dioxygenase family protein [Cupriavidus metallidurans]
MKLIATSDVHGKAGIITYNLVGATIAKEGATFVAELDGQVDQAVSAMFYPNDAVVFNVHTHLLKNGAHTLTVSTRHALLGTVTASAEFSVMNGSELSEQVADLLTKSNVPVLFAGLCDSSFYPYGAAEATAWFDRPDADAHIERLLSQGEIDATEAEALRGFVKNGFMVLEDLLDDELVAAVNGEIDHAIESGYQGYEYGTSQRIEHLHVTYPNMRKLWLDRRHLRFADTIFNGLARPCQTLTYVFGSQQDAHQDTIHLTPFPAGYMCGIWIALQDVQEDSGELIVYPGSHREPRVYLRNSGCEKVQSDWSEFGAKVVPMWKDMASRYEPFVYRPKKGTVLIWHENLLHAGSVRRDMSRPRRSVVIHTFADGAIGYYDSTGMAGSAVNVQQLTQTV